MLHRLATLKMISFKFLKFKAEQHDMNARKKSNRLISCRDMCTDFVELII